MGEVDSGSARLLATHSNLAEPESTSPIFMLKFLIHLVAAERVKLVILSAVCCSVAAADRPTTPAGVRLASDRFHSVVHDHSLGNDEMRTFKLGRQIY